MKKITLFFAFLLATFAWQTNAQAVTDNFDSYTAGDDPTGWTKYQTEADDPGFIVTDGHANSAPNSLYHNDDNVATESTSWVVAPVYVSTGDDMLEFYYMQRYTPSYYRYSGVWYSTTGSDPTQNPGDWTELAEFNGTDQPLSNNVWSVFRHTFSEAAGTNIYVAFKYIGDYNHEFFIDDFKIDVAPAYLNPTFDLSLTNVDCANSQFSVNVNVTDLGGASSVTVSDDQGSASQQLSAPGTVSFGPYASGTAVNFTVTNDDDNSFASSDSITYTCPANNDDCFNATALTVYAVGAGAGNETSIDPASYTDSGSHPSCDDVGVNIDMWFTVTIPAGQTGFKAIYSGDGAVSVEAALWDSCGGSDLACFNQTNNAYHVFEGLTAGQTYYLQLWLDDFRADPYSVVLEELPPAPNCAENPVPADGATGVVVQSGRKIDLSWDAPTTGPAPDSYKFEIGFASGNYVFTTTLTSPSLTLIGFDQNTTYYWKVSPINGGVTATGCPEWSFTTGAFPPVANDACSGAVALNVDADACVSPTVVDNTYATDSGEAAPSCSVYNGGDLWFTVTVPASGSVSIATSEVAGSNVGDTALAVYSGACGGLAEIGCNDDIDSQSGNYFSQLDLTGQTPGDVLYVRVWTYNNASFGEFNICAWDPDANALSENTISGFKFYPNPVNHTLNLSAKDNIEMISISNIMGQEVLNVKPNATQTQVDMSHLQNGVYFVKAQVNGQLTAFKVVKK